MAWQMTDTERLALTIPETAKRLGIGRRQAYAAAERGEIPTFRIGNSIRVPVVGLENLLNGQFKVRLGKDIRKR